MPLVLAVSWEVFARYAFDAPTILAFDVTYMLYATIFMLGVLLGVIRNRTSTTVAILVHASYDMIAAFAAGR